MRRVAVALAIEHAIPVVVAVFGAVEIRFEFAQTLEFRANQFQFEVSNHKFYFLIRLFAFENLLVYFYLVVVRHALRFVAGGKGKIAEKNIHASRTFTKNT